jgi:hypothetical protein
LFIDSDTNSGWTMDSRAIDGPLISANSVPLETLLGPHENWLPNLTIAPNRNNIVCVGRWTLKFAPSPLTGRLSRSYSGKSGEGRSMFDDEFSVRCSTCPLNIDITLNIEHRTEMRHIRG